MAVDKEESRDSGKANDANEGSEEEIEYEIEGILDAKRGMFPHGRIGYFVRWKGYGEEENSWVDEADAGNADELIKEFWNKKKSRKTEGKGKRGRKSTGPVDEESGTDSMSVSTRKRGRKSQAVVGSEELDEEGVRMQKKARTGTPLSVAENNVTTQDEGGDIIIGDMSKYDSWPSWEDLVAEIDTVEKDVSGNVMVYFTLKSGERIRESTDVVKARCPQKLLTFYEMHLRWREAEVEDTYV